jgi:hypothetical protein
MCSGLICSISVSVLLFCPAFLQDRYDVLQRRDWTLRQRLNYRGGDCGAAMMFHLSADKTPGVLVSNARRPERLNSEIPNCKVLNLLRSFQRRFAASVFWRRVIFFCRTKIFTR